MNIDEIFDDSMNTEPSMAAAAACVGHGCCMHSFAGAAAPVGPGGMLGSSGNSSATPSPPETPMMPPSSMFREMPPTYLQPVPPPRRPRPKITYNFCVFCKNNGEDEMYYLSHTLKNDDGLVTCPVLSAYICPICGATGPVAHTIKYCPNNKDDAFSQGYAPITLLKQMRTSTGRPRALMGGVGGFLPGFPGRPLTYGPIGSSLPPMSQSRMRGPGPASMSRGGGMFYGGSPFDSPPITPGFGMGLDSGFGMGPASGGGGGGGFQMYGGGLRSDSGTSRFEDLGSSSAFPFPIPAPTDN